MSPSVVERLAAWAVGLAYEDIPPRVRERARYQILNVMAALHAAVNAGAGESVARAVSKWDSHGRATMFPSGDTAGLHAAVLVNNARSLALDYDDYLYLGHSGHSAVLAAWAVAETYDCDTRKLLTAQVIANELEGRLGASVVLGPQNGQAWSFIHALGGAAVTAKLLGLDVTQTAHALAIALYQPSFTLWPGFFGPTSKELTSAVPTVNGIMAAQFAAEGMTGAREIIEEPRQGFWRHFSFAPLPAMMTGLGRAWVSDTLTYKLYPGCAYIDTTMDAMLELLAEFRDRRGRDLVPADVAAIRVEASLLTVGMDNLSAGHAGSELNPALLNFAIPANLAIAILAGRLTSAQMRPEFLRAEADAIRELAAKVTLVHDWSMTAEVVRAFSKVLGPGVLRQALLPRDLARIVPGLSGHLGGGRRTELGLGKLLRANAGELWALLGELRRGGGPASLDEVDFSGFEMMFPSQVTLETTDGWRLVARQSIPRGAPGTAGYPQVVEEKYQQEAAPRCDQEQVSAAIAGIKALEETRLATLKALICELPAV